MVVEKIILLLGAFEVAGAGVYLLLLNLLFENLVWGTVEEYRVMLVWSVAVLFCLSLGLCRRLSVLNFGVLFLPCRRA